MAHTYQNGFNQGKTEATLEGIAKAQDVIFEQLNRLPCGKRGELISELRTTQRNLWALMFFLMAAIAGLALQSIFG